MKRGVLGRKSHTLHSIVSLSFFLWFIHCCFPCPLLSVCDASLQMVNTMIVMHHSTIMCGMWFVWFWGTRELAQHSKPFPKGGSWQLWWFFNLSFHFDTFIKCFYVFPSLGNPWVLVFWKKGETGKEVVLVFWFWLCLFQWGKEIPRVTGPKKQQEKLLTHKNGRCKHRDRWQRGKTWVIENKR